MKVSYNRVNIRLSYTCAFHEDIWGSGGTVARNINLGVRWGERGQLHIPLTLLLEKALSFLFKEVDECVPELVGTLERCKIFCASQKSNIGTPGIQPLG